MNKFQVIADIVAVVVALAAGVISGFALVSSNGATASTARAEITEYAGQMIQLDRAADERNTTQITVLAEQADAVIDSYRQSRLKLAPSTYRVLAQYTTLNTDNRQLAFEFGSEAVELAAEQKNLIEEIRAHRVLADLAGKNGDVQEMRNQVTIALAIADADPQDTGNTQVLRNSITFTGVFAVYSALLANINGAGPEACQAVDDYFKEFKEEIAQQAGAQSLEVSRRAYRLRNNMNSKQLCGLDPQKDLYLSDFRDVWLGNPGRS